VQVPDVAPPSLAEGITRRTLMGSLAGVALAVVFAAPADAGTNSDSRYCERAARPSPSMASAV
jgi:hypothetical protein